VKVLSNGITSEETSILHDNVLSGTATRSAINCPTAAKTGTTSELVDAWLDGYTPNYSTVVWMGYPNKRVSMTDVHGEPQQGGYLPAEIWHDYMSAVTEGQKCAEFPPATEPLSYQPFFGKFESTGLESHANENSEENAGKHEYKNGANKLQHAAHPGQGAGGGAGGSGAGGGGARTEAPTPHTGGPSEPGGHSEPKPGDGGGTVKGTGGAAPG
jgi:penicillin-binding protein 1A